MKIAVCVKNAVDETELKVDPGGNPQLRGAPTKMSTFDKNAVEEALRLKAAHQGEVVVVTVGTSEAKKTMKEALAMGSDRGILVSADPMAMDNRRTSELLAAALKKGGPYDMILCSEGSSDMYSGLVPPMLGELLGLPYVGYAKKIDVSGKSAKVERALEDSIDVVEAPLPLVVSVVSEINEPRYPTLIQIMQAGKKPMEELIPETLLPGVAPAMPLVGGMKAQAMTRKRVVFEGPPAETAKKLVDALAAEGVLPR
ncbi:MAG TPA: electron transfer flavoprotein subunit beta/FixA family protein [Nitrososphaerales archaeon]|nr:electron transfer flavoprotein subunit beta/FixA family protein [Nitrososphaerales archaeon]